MVFYEYMQQPPFWIAYDEQAYWLVPVRAYGWAERELFVGRVMGLRRVTNQALIDLICHGDIK